MTTRSEEPAVQVRNLLKQFDHFTAVDRVTFEVKKGEIFGFLGPNGAGKSTTIRMLCGILEPSGGEGKVAGFDVYREAESIKAHIGYMSQKFSLYPDLTVEENINFFSGIYRIPQAERQARKEWVIAMAGLTEHRHAITSVLSGGWKQRLALGCALLHRPPILFLDEPTSGVDPISRRRFWDLIHELSGKGVTVFVTTHYMDEAEYCDRLGMIFAGQLIALGTPEELKHRFMHEKVLEIFCEQPLDVIAAIQERKEVKDVTLFGNGLHAVVWNEADARDAITQTLAAKGWRLDRMEAIAPTLEDVFVSLIEEHSRRHPGVGEVVS